jgi:glycosyltransferase involved in cell wall biosynthesis
MKILHLACVAPPETGGIGQTAFEIVRRLVNRGEQVTLIAPQLRGKRTEPDGPFLKRLPTFIRWGNAAALSNLNPHLAEADVIHLHYPFYGTAEQVAEYCLWHKKPLVMTFHMDAKAPMPLGIIFDLYRVFAQPAILRACKKIIVSSFDYADTSSIAGFKREHPDRFAELPFGVDHAWFHPGADARTRFGFTPEMNVVGFVGVMDHAHRFKGILELLAAAKDLPADVRLLLVGDGDQRRVYEAKAKELGITERCHFAGRLSHDELVEAYRSMDVFAFPSTSAAEAFGLVAAEAQACGVPVVASNLPGVRTVIRDGETGILVPPMDVNALRGALSKIVDDQGLRSRMSEAAHQFALARFNWDMHVNGLMDVYREVTNR